MFVNNFGKCKRIFKILSSVDSHKKFYVPPQRFAPHLQYVATLRCESQKSKKMTAPHQTVDMFLRSL